ncbi:S8 family serine peptidase [Bdellovibrio sp. HCB2-146]|uniref:S8 family serine peptidase n=1 Tax=Bdellovibrio sp. HCB2-146 TaxID=3394362 RepID=UPI0039BC4BE3
MKTQILLSVVLGLSLSAHADPFSEAQWGLRNGGQPQMIDLDPLHTYKVPARQQEDVRVPAPFAAKKKVIVAVMDTGIQKNHPDLKGVIHRNESECKALDKFEQCVQDKDRKTCEKIWMDPKNPEVDQDKNGYPMDCEGWSLLGGKNEAGILGRPDFGDDQGHGTHVSGIIAAIKNNGIGVEGVSSNVEILPVQVIGLQPSEPIKPLSIYDSPSEEGREEINRSLGDMVARGVIYAMRSGAQVINFSMGWPQAKDSEFMREVIKQAQDRGVIIVAAAGNDSTRALLRPCAYANVICVGSSGPDGAFSHFSNYGSGVDILAPGTNILSTYPESKRPVRFRSTLGYEYLSGTSQATPFVAAAAAELLARGIPAKEVYARLVLGARQPQSNLSLLEGGSHTEGKILSPEREVYKKYSVAGNLDIESSLKVQPQALIVPALKEKIEIPWDRQAKDLTFEISFVNRFADIAINDVTMKAEFVKPHAEAVRPWITGIKEVVPYQGVWKSGEVRKYVVSMSIVDSKDPAQSRIPSELDLAVDVQVKGQETRRHIFESEIIVNLMPAMTGEDVLSIPLQGMPVGRQSFLPIDENLDLAPERRDYFAVSQQKGTWQVWLIADTGVGAYTTVGGTKIKVVGEEKLLREQVNARIDMEDDGQSEYVLGVIEDKSEVEPTDETKEEDMYSPMSFFVFDSKMKLKDSFVYKGDIAATPYAVYWQKVGNTKRPAWVGGGKDPDKKRSLRDRWENPEGFEKPETRFYYMNEKNELKAIQKYEDYHIIDVIQPRREQVAAGRVPLLLAKNLGTESKPSYLYSFAVAEAVNGKIENFMELDLFANQNTYRNILDTRVDKVQSLNYSKDEYVGSYWFGEGINREQRLSFLDSHNWELLDRALGAERSQFDSALWVRAVFAGLQRKGAFVLTNSEIQYHDLINNKVVSKSFERYTFFPDMLMTNLYFPVTLKDRFDASSKLPALFTTETSELSRGVKMLVPALAKDGTLMELVSPARLRFKSAAGCRPMDTPVFTGEVGAHSFDYYCGTKILRVNLVY